MKNKEIFEKVLLNFGYEKINDLVYKGDLIYVHLIDFHGQTGWIEAGSSNRDFVIHEMIEKGKVKKEKYFFVLNDKTNLVCGENLESFINLIFNDYEKTEQWIHDFIEKQIPVKNSSRKP